MPILRRRDRQSQHHDAFLSQGLYVVAAGGAPNSAAGRLLVMDSARLLGKGRADVLSVPQEVIDDAVERDFWRLGFCELAWGTMRRR